MVSEMTPADLAALDRWLDGLTVAAELVFEYRGPGEYVARFAGLPYWAGQWDVRHPVSRRGNWYGRWTVGGHGIGGCGVGPEFDRLDDAKAWLLANAARLAPADPQPPADDGLPF